MPISEHEVKALAHQFWAFVQSGDPGPKGAHFFINEGILVPSGELLGLEQHQEMHRKLCKQSHSWKVLNF